MNQTTHQPDTGKGQPEELAASRFLWLIGVFLAGFLLVVGLKAFFSHLHDELGARSANERARLFIGEEIVRAIQAVEKARVGWKSGLIAPSAECNTVHYAQHA